ncbi:hypothetical protein CVV26_00435 [Candidatus Kuenenbacteria bacterium HGW-Kuenenbacteria-1]|uniref:RNA polymerase sigma-70 domain-containing protein n=1 Tax=Candidatus Kuenenbacteria bacterium HGW-Kuenenbacteria-1 TaxID=2013812 RepID=A0A2N1UPD8_9BACT|nr:MAG: hypothetical protein CVV26_00435 [Candidatus Kuenenbacteria bacterium HGW-Kuenenbacteria-1]
MRENEFYFNDKPKDENLLLEEEIEEGSFLEKGKEFELFQKNEELFQALELENAKEERNEKEIKKIKDTIILANRKLVIFFVNKYRDQGLEVSDLIQEGNIGLLEAVEKFDYRKGYKFSTYAIFWIKQEVVRAIAEQSRIIHLPEGIIQKIGRFEQAKNTLIQELQREPSLEEIAKKMGVDHETIRSIMQAFQKVVSLETPANNDGDTVLGDFISNEEPVIKQEIVSERFMSYIKERIFQSQISQKKKDILGDLFGLNNVKLETEEEIGEKYNCSRQYVSATKKKFIKKIKGLSEFEKLYMELFRNSTKYKKITGFDH